MKNSPIIVIVVLLALFVDGCGGNNKKNSNPFSISPEGIKKAIQFGKNSDSKVGEFGRYDFGFNRFELGADVGYVEIATPFIEIARAAKRNDFKDDDTIKIAKRKPFVVVILHLTKEKMDGKFDCLLKTKRETIDLSDNVTTSSYWDEKTGKGTKGFMYELPVEKILDESEFTLVLKNEIIGEREFLIKSSDLK